VPQTRREFITQAAAASAAIGIAGCAPATVPPPAAAPAPAAAAGGDPTFKDLAMLALDAAKSAGASYADVRISRNRNQAIFTREQRVQNLVDNETFGFGVRVLVDGAWGFAASRDLTRDEVARVARQAAAQARANRTTLVRPVTLARVTPTPDGSWRSSVRLDPFEVPIEDKVALLLAANAASLAVPGARFVNSQMFFLREEKTLATTDGTYVVQTIFRAQPTLTVTAVAPDNSDFQTRQSNDVQPM
jgi:TldD protein